MNNVVNDLERTRRKERKGKEREEGEIEIKDGWRREEGLKGERKEGREKT